MPFNILDAFIFLHIYGLFIVPPAFLGGLFYLVRYLSFPLLTRSPCELVIIAGPDRVKVYRIKERYQPMFTTRKGAYWFTKGKTLNRVYKRSKKVEEKRVKIAEAQIGEPGKFGRQKVIPAQYRVEKSTIEGEVEYNHYAKNKIHVYLDSVNQPIYDLERISTKTSDVLTHFQPSKQAKAHSVQIPPSGLSFQKNWALIIKGDTVELEVTRIKQPYKVNFFTRMGIYIVEKKEATSSNASDQLQSVSIQTVVQKIGDIEQNANFSASYALKLIKSMRYMDRKWVNKLIGKMDMKLIMVLMMAIMMIAVIFIFFKPGNPLEMLPPPPTGCVNC